MKKILVKIKDGLIVRDPVTKQVFEGEVKVTLTTFWRRRIKDGDAVEIKKLSETKVKAEEPVKKDVKIKKEKIQGGK